MSWVTMDTAELIEGSTVRGYVNFDYDDSSTGANRACRLIIVPRQGHTFRVNFNNIIVDGYNYGSVSSLTQDSGTFWTGDLSGGNTHNAQWTNPWYAGTRTPSVSGTVPASGTPPSGGFVNDIVPQWDRITATVGVSDWGGYGSGNMELKILKEPYYSGVPARQVRWDNVSSAQTGTVTNDSITISNPTWVIQGCSFYHTGVWATNASGQWYRYQGPTTYTPPAPGQLSYSLTPGVGSSIDATINYTGIAANNDPNYDASELKHTVRYYDPSLIVPGLDPVYIYIANNVTAGITDVTSGTVNINASGSIVVESWMTYHGLKSEVSTLTIVNSNNPTDIYISVGGDTKLVSNVYGSVDNLTSQVVKVYGSVEGVARKVYQINV